jgi:hypothetical protein
MTKGIMCPLWRHAAGVWRLPSATVSPQLARQRDPALVNRTMPSLSSLLWCETMGTSSRSSSSAMWQSESEGLSTIIGDKSFHAEGRHVRGTKLRAFASNEGGFDEVKSRYRSILYHPLGLPLACLLNDATLPTTESITNQIVGDNKVSMELNNIIKSRSSGLVEFQELLKSWVISSFDGEPNVRGSLAESITELLRANETPTLLCVQEQSTETGRICEYDQFTGINILFQRHLGSTEDPAVLLIEVGLKNEDWWLKVDQSLIQFKRLGKAFSEPLLLAVFTVCGDKELSKVQACLGVFLISPKGSEAGDFRVSLLWRSHFSHLEDLAIGFERITRATVFLAKWNEHLKNKKLNHEFLGTHCCRIGEKVNPDQKVRIIGTYDSLTNALPSVRVYRSFDVTTVVWPFPGDDRTYILI